MQNPPRKMQRYLNAESTRTSLLLDCQKICGGAELDSSAYLDLKVRGLIGYASLVKRQEPPRWSWPFEVITTTANPRRQDVMNQLNLDTDILAFGEMVVCRAITSLCFFLGSLVLAKMAWHGRVPVDTLGWWWNAE